MTRACLVLRPEPGAGATAAAAGRRGLEAVVAPLFAVRAVVPDRHALPAAPAALLFTSQAAVRALGEWAEGWRDRPAYAVGAATAAALARAGFTRVVAGTAGVDAIVATAAAAGVPRLLHLAGREHRVPAAARLPIDRLVCYAADEVATLPPAATAALAAGAVPLLHSPRAAARLAALVAAETRAATRLAALSPAVAAAAGPGWARIAVATQPTDAALLDAVETLLADALPPG